MRASGVLQLPPAAVASSLYHHRLSRPSSYLSFGTTNKRSIRNEKRGRLSISWPVFVNKEETSSDPISTSNQEEIEIGYEPDPQDLEYVSKIKNVLELLKKNRDMQFNEVKLTIMIEDPRDVERRRLLGIDDENAPTRDDLADVLVQVNEGKIPEDRDALRMLAEEISRWPNLEVEISKKKPPGKSLYAKFTDTGVSVKEAAKRLNIDWDTAAEIEGDETDQMELPSMVGFGALYLVSAFPIIIGVSVVLILFYNSLQ